LHYVKPVRDNPCLQLVGELPELVEIDAPREPESERVVEDLLVSREIAQVDFGLDLLITQPST
jgi:hypothetical protein